MPQFLWYQQVGGTDPWREALSIHREKIIKETKPAFVTVLDASSAPEDSWGQDEYAKLRYSGPAYFDFDNEDLSEAIPRFQEFLNNLKDMGVNLASLRLYATGGRGFHIEIPEAIFMPKISKTGVLNLPYIYKEMAFSMVVDTLDMRVYTGRRGRMWRTPGVVRSNGLYKVAISVADALSMTVELYKEVCAAPVPEPIRDLPELNPTLAAMFIKAQSKLEEAVKRRAKAGADVALLARFKGQVPPTIARMMSGEGLMPGAGFHGIAMQMAVTAHALGKSSEELVAACEGLVKTHDGDSSRYGSPRKRKDELRRMWEYTHDNVCYTYSRGAIRALLAPGTASGDLDGMGENVGIGHVPDNDGDEEDDELQGTGGDEVPAEVSAELDASDNSLLEGLMIVAKGIYRRTSDGAKALSNIGFTKPAKMLDADDGMLIGIEAGVLADGVRKGRKLLPMKAFTSRANLSAYCAGFGGVFSGSDNQAGVVQVMLSRSADKRGRVIYIVRKEGLDLIQNPLVKDKPEKDVLWVATDSVRSHNSDVQYRYQALVGSKESFNTDIHLTKAIEKNADTAAWLHSLLAINDPLVVAQMLGWFVSCFHRQFYHEAFSQFPLLHPNGPAGSGKTLTSKLMARLFYNTSEPVVKGCSHNAITDYPLKAILTASASIPLILDEYKPSELGPRRTDFLLTHFRMLYNQGAGASGGMNRGAADSSFRDVTNYTYSTPVVFLGESQEMQTAVVQRTLPVSFNPDDAKANTAHFAHAEAGKAFMPRLGHLLLLLSMGETVESRRTALEPIIKDLRANFDRSVHDRQVFNLAIVFEGLNFLGRALGMVFGSEFDADLEALKASLYEHKADVNVSVMSEPAKALNDITLISRTEDSESEFAIRENYEYVMGEGYIEILMRETFIKYFSWCKRKGMNPLYTNADSFIGAMGKFPATVDKLCQGSPLRTSGQSRVFRFSLEKLQAEGIEMPKSKSLG